MTNWFCIQTNGLQLRHHEATPLLCLIMESVVRPFIYFWPRLILSVYPLQLTLTADQQEKIHTAFYVPGLPRKTMRCTYIIQTQSQRHTCALPHARFLVFLLHQGAGSITFKVKECTYQIMETNALFAMHYTCRKKERLRVRERKTGR